MITQVYFRPKFLAPAYNPVMWSVQSNKVTFDPANPIYDFQYVFDVIIDGAFINRFRQRPNPAGAGMIDVSNMVAPFLNVGAFANEVGTSLSTPMKTASDALCNVLILCGEEYRAGKTDSPLQIYNGITNTLPGEPAYVLGAQGPSEFNAEPVICFPWTLPWQQQQETLAVQENSNLANYYGLYGDLAPYVLKNNSKLAATTCGGTGLFMTRAPRSVPANGDWRTTSAQPAHNVATNVLAYDRYTLTWLNRNPSYQYYAGGSLLQYSAPKVAWFEFYDASGTNIGHYAVGNYQSFGGAPRQGCGSSISDFSTSVNQEMVSLRVGPKDLEDLNVFAGLSGVCTSYTVQLFGDLAIAGNCSYSGSPSTPLSEIVTFKIVEDCTSYLYPRARLVWLNTLGSREYYNFTMFNEETFTTKNTNYYQPEIQWSQTTPVRLTGDTTENWLHGGNVQVNKVVESKRTIMTDWLLQDEVDWLKETVKSPQTWLYIGSNDFPYTCKVTDTSYTVKTIKQVKMYALTLTVEINTDRTMQIV